MVLVLMHKWYDMIKSGCKKQEYRTDKPYYRARLANLMKLPPQDRFIEFRRGYTSTSMMVKFEGFIEYDGENTEQLSDLDRMREWGFDPAQKILILKLGEIAK